MVATNIVGSKYLVAHVPVLFLLTMRFSLAFVMLLPLHWLSKARKNSLKYYFSQLNKTDWKFIIAQALSAGVLFNSLMLLGLHFTDANIAGIITSALPAIIVLLSWIILGEKISSKKSLCIFFATLGLIIISVNKFYAANGVHPSMIGGILILISLIPEGSYYVLSKMHPNRLPVFLISAIINGINALFLLPIIFIFMHWQLLQLSEFGWFILCILVFGFS